MTKNYVSENAEQDVVEMSLSEAIDAALAEPSGEPEEDAIPQDSAQAEEDNATGEEEGEAMLEGSLEAPEDWPEEDRTVFDALSEDARALTLKFYKSFQRGFTRKTQALSDKERLADALAEAFQPYRDQMKAVQLDEPAAVRKLLALHKMFSDDPVSYVRYITDTARVSLDDVARCGPVNPPSLPQGPVIDRGLWEAFQYASDDAGALKYPHLDQVRHRMDSLLQNGLASSLEDAYEQAVWADPILRKAHLQAERRKVEDTLRTERRHAAERARKTRGKAVSSPSVPVTINENDDLRTVIRTVVDRHYG